MIIKTLVEDTTSSESYKCIHGLCLYIETELHKILFDLGPNDLFLKNAKKMGVNIEDIDTVIISHGHYDHGGGLKYFLKNNQKAKIYIHASAFEPHYAGMLGMKFEVGLDRKLENDNRLIRSAGILKIDDELQLFSDIDDDKYLPKSNHKLYKKTGKQYIQDTFEHEQNLIIRENDTYALFTACSHNGIINIVEKAESICSQEMKYVIGGYHFYQLMLQREDNRIFLENVASFMTRGNTIYYTCHCTGVKVYEFMRLMMKKQLNYLSTGNEIELK
ncbi:MAG: MBL fold metallo-hydrolase [Mobilitalea sp.]